MHGSGDGGWGDGACLESMVLHTFTLLLHATVLRCTSHSNFLTLNGNSHFFFRFGYDFKKKEYQHYTHSYTYLLSVVEIKIRPHYQMTSLTFDVTETTLILDKVFFQVYSSKRGYFYNNQNKGASLLLMDLHKSFIMVGTFEREAFT